MYTDDQFQWITMLEKVGPVVEQSNITELLMDSGAASHVRPCRMTAGYSYEEAFLKATGAQVTSQVHGEKITVKAMFELLTMRCPILSEKRLLSSWKMNADTSNTRRTERYPFTSTMVCSQSRAHWRMRDDHAVDPKIITQMHRG